jgi:hypothetical protein
MNSIFRTSIFMMQRGGFARCKSPPQPACPARWSNISMMRRATVSLGVAYDLAEMKVTLADLVGRYHEEFMGLLPYEEALALGFGPGYTRLDALVLYAMLRARKPKRYVEVGSGLSTPSFPRWKPLPSTNLFAIAVPQASRMWPSAIAPSLSKIGRLCALPIYRAGLHYVPSSR